ncbi:hypothetical protein KY304_00985, partial [Candidatus Woesearchaeota archaeon]|nr:hypothetical protein [Candidatus Woesearchaeota archaeon]
MEELSERAKIMLVFDSYLQKTGYNLPELRENYKEIESILKIATKLGGGEEKNLSHRIDITMATDYAVFIYLKKEDSPDTQYRLIRFKETIKDVKERLNPEEVIQIYANSEIIVKHYEKQIRKINAERKKTKRKNKPVQIIQNFPENDKPKKNKPLISEKT